MSLQSDDPASACIPHASPQHEFSRIYAPRALRLTIVDLSGQEWHLLRGMSRIEGAVAEGAAEAAEVIAEHGCEPHVTAGVAQAGHSEHDARPRDEGPGTGATSHPRRAEGAE